jgi:argininosuccinate lyase
LQEDKEGMFDSADTILTSLSVMDGMLSTLTVNRVNMEKATEQDFSNATELADYLCGKGSSF